MTIRISGKNISIGEALQERVKERIGETIGRYFDGDYSGHVTITKDRLGFRTDCVLHLARGTVLETEAVAGDAYASADNAVVAMEKRLRRHKGRLKDRYHGKANGNGQGSTDVEAQSYVIEPPSEDDGEVAAYSPVTVAESTTTLRRLSVAEAVMELDMTGSPVMCFVNDGSGRVNVVYRRPDGNIGWIDPPAAAA
jgi:ribosomal subunit interface protein